MTPITGEISLFLELDFKEKRVTISDYSLVDNSIKISNVYISHREFINTYNLIKIIVKIQVFEF